MVKWVMVLATFLALAACSSANDMTGVNKKESDPFQHQTYLTLVGFTGSVCAVTFS
jgi:hypothetical protein